MQNDKADELIQHYSSRKVNAIVEKTMSAFRSAISEHDMLGVDEAFSIGFALFMNTVVLPMEQMATDKDAVRKEIAREFCYHLENAHGRTLE